MLYWSTACGIDADRYAWLIRAREHAAGRLEVHELNGQSLKVKPRGSGPYPVLRTCAEFSVQLTEPIHIPTAYVRLRSSFLHEVGGPSAAYESSPVVVRALCARPVVVPNASRLDVYADFGGWVLTDAIARVIAT